MSWPYVSGTGALIPFTVDQVKALGFGTREIRNGDNPTLNLDSQGCSVNRMWFCNWTKRDDAIAYLLGAVSLAGTFPNWTLSRIMPNPFPDPGYEQYIALACVPAKGARSAGKDDARVVPAYKSASLDIRHELVFWGLGADGAVPEYNRYVEQLPSTTDSSYLTIPGSMMNYRNPTLPFLVPSGVLIPYSIGRVEVVQKLAYKWHRLPYEAWYPGSPLFKRVKGDPSNTTVVPVVGAPAGMGKAVGLPYVGMVNSVAWNGYPAGTLLFDGVDEEIVPDPVRGFPCWNLTLRFISKQNVGVQGNTPIGYGGHNYLYYGGRQNDSTYSGFYFAVKGDTWYPNGSIADGLCLFNERNLLNLFSVGAVVDADI